MLINEAGVVRAIKRAYKGGGYTVNSQGGVMSIYTQSWYIFQAESLACWGIPLSYLGMVDRDAAEHDSAIVVDNCRLLWDDGTEAIAVEAVRKAKSGWAKAWERAVWEALEGVDLHKEE